MEWTVFPSCTGVCLDCPLHPHTVRLPLRGEDGAPLVPARRTLRTGPPTRPLCVRSSPGLQALRQFHLDVHCLITVSQAPTLPKPQTFPVALRDTPPPTSPSPALCLLLKLTPDLPRILPLMGMCSRAPSSQVCVTSVSLLLILLCVLHSRVSVTLPTGMQPLGPQGPLFTGAPLSRAAPA